MFWHRKPAVNHASPGPSIVLCAMLSLGAGWLIAQSEPSSWEKSVKIDGRPLSIVCRGEGAPTVILENGYGHSTSMWSVIDRRIAELTRVCAYEQPGLKRTPEGPEPRTAGEVADALQALLAETGVKGPYVLVGQSFGGLVVRLFAARRLEETAALVLLDSPHEDVYQEFARVLEEIGKDPSQARGTPEVETSLQQVREEAASLGDLPVLVIGHGKNRPRRGYTPEQDAKMENAWRLLQQRLATISSRGRYVTAEKSSHAIFRDDPDMVVEAITQLVQEARRQ